MLAAIKVTLFVFIAQIIVLLGTAALFKAYGGSIAHEISTQDAREYMLLADSLLEDGRFHLPLREEPETWRTPGYPAFVAGVFAVTGSSLAVLLVILALVGAATSGLIYLIGRELMLSHRWSFAAGVLFGLSPAVIWIPPSGMGGDIVFAFLLTLAIYLVLRASDWRWFVAIGIVLGLATLVRPLGLYLSPIIIFAAPLLANRSLHVAKMVALLLAGFILVITPWMLRNYSVTEHFSLTSQFAFNPFYYNLPIFYAWQNGTGEDAERIKLMDEVGTRDVYALVNGFTYSDELSLRAKTFLKDNLVPYGFFHLYKTIPFFVGSGVNVIYATITNEIPRMPDVPFFPRATQNTATLFYGGEFGAVTKNILYYWPSTLERLLWLVVFVLAFAAPFVTKGRTQRFVILGAALTIVIALLASPIAQPRYRLPAEPFIWLSAAFTCAILVPSLGAFLRKKKEVVAKV